MLGTVKRFSVGYNPINASNVFTSGDTVNGQITLELSEVCKIDSVHIKLKGKAEASFERYGWKTKESYSKVKYFSQKKYFKGTFLGQGTHIYPFSIQIPAQELPSSFHGNFGRILYTLEANLSRSMRVDSKAKAELNIIHRGNPDPMLMSPKQFNFEEKLFNSGTIGMDVNIERMGFRQGEGIKVTASIQNRSSRKIKPKYCLYKKCSYFVGGWRKVETKDILKEESEAVPPSAGLTVTKIITIPPTTPASILNCNIIKVEYRLRVYLDVKYASDPEIKFPIIILPALQGPQEVHSLASPEVQLPPYPAYGFEAFPNSSMAGGTSFLQNSTASGPFAPPPAYGSWLDPPLTDFDRKSKSTKL